MFTVEAHIPWVELEERVRKVPLLQERDGQPVYPYENAEISVREVSLTDVKPTTLYVVRGLLSLQERLALDLYRQGYDPLELEQGLIINDSVSKSNVGLIPPLVEETRSDGVYFLDGAHRTFHGRRIGRTTVKALFISGVREDCPAYAVPNEWHEIVEYDDVPDNPLLKKHYRDNYRGLYRDFGSINSTHIREKGSEKI